MKHIGLALFLVLIAGAFSLASAAEGPATLPRISLLFPGSSDPGNERKLDAFRQGLELLA